MKLLDVYERGDATKFLFDLLKERTPDQSISHKSMPSWDDHVDFVRSEPYRAWYLIDDGGYVGAVYLTERDEIGVFVKKEFQGRGYGKWAVEELMRIHGSRNYYANINPHNTRSIQMFEDMGFELIQYTYVR